MTLANIRENGVRMTWANCDAYAHQADVNVEALAKTLVVPRLGRRLRATGKVHVGHAPPYSVVAPGVLPGKPLPDGSTGPSLYCAVIVKTVDAQTRAKTGINELLRE